MGLLEYASRFVPGLSSAAGAAGAASGAGGARAQGLITELNPCLASLHAASPASDASQKSGSQEHVQVQAQSSSSTSSSSAAAQPSSSSPPPPSSSPSSPSSAADASIPASSLPSLLRAHAPTLLHGSFQPTRWLSLPLTSSASGHAQTIYSVLAPTEKEGYDPVKYKSVRHLISHLVTPTAERGSNKLYRCAVINFRGCANTPVTSRQLYSAMKTSDYASGLAWIRNHWPASCCIGVGFSLGANVVSRYLGEWGDAAQLWGGAVLAAPFDTLAGSHSLESGLLGPIYSRAMCNNLSALGRAHKDTLALCPQLRPALRHLLAPPTAETEELDKQRGQKRGTLRWVDDTITRLVGGYEAPYGMFPFDTSHDYYSNAGALAVLQQVQRPLLVLNADDDPIVAPESVKGVRRIIGLDDPHPSHDERNTASASTTTSGQGNANIVLCTTRGGGHLGWWQGNRNPKRWLAQPVGEFVDAVANGAKHVLARRAASSSLSSTSSSEQEHQEGKASGPSAARKTKRVPIQVELLDAQALPSWDLQLDEALVKEAQSVGDGVDGGQGEGSKNANNGSAPTTSAKAAALAPVKGGKHAWLLTPVLPAHQDAPRQLLHPSMSPKYRGPDKGQGEVLDLFMTVDAEKPEIAYCLLPTDSKVAGAGSLFRGGIDTPGSEAAAASSSGTIRGL